MPPPVGLFVGLLVAAFGSVVRAEVRMPNVFSDHMVLQQQAPIVVWGWAQPGEAITVQISTHIQKVKANEAGEWKAVLPSLSAGGPYTLTVIGSNRLQFEDVLVGEVWLCSGQSNMEMGIGMVKNGEQEIAEANYPKIRLLKVPKRWSPEPQTNFDGAWKVCSPQTISQGGWNGFSAAGYYFGRELYRKLQVPIGLIDSTWGGTKIESWTPPEGFAAVPALHEENYRVQTRDPRNERYQAKLKQVLDNTEQWLAAARNAMHEQKLVPPMPSYPEELLPAYDVQHATALFNGMIHPLCPFALRGAIWYQGESNLGEGMLYCERMKALVGGWRQIWGEGDFAFYFVQIAPYNYGANPQAEPELWEAQAAAAQAIPNSGMAVINDIGDLKDIHPINKQEVGRRLALWALAKTYGESNLVYTGPMFKAMLIESNTLRVTFEHIGGGLQSRDGRPLSWFEIIDRDEGGFVKADARIDGSSVVLSAPNVNHPVAVRFAWSMLAEPNLANAEGLPAGAFRAGTVPVRDLLAMYVAEAKDYRLVYDLDLSRLGASLAYSVDNHRELSEAFDRIAYFLELQGNDGDPQYVYASMDAFTRDAGKIGVPALSTGAFFQQPVSNLNVLSNVKGIVTGSGLAGGNVEFWPNNYAPNNSAKVPNASDSVYDFGDAPTNPNDGYGSMQLHNHDARQTVFAVNNWKAGGRADIGIGNQPQNNPDWTFAANAGSYLHKRLRVLVHTAPRASASQQPANSQVVDASSLRGKVLCGYQGWFRCPGDDAHEGWIHWSGAPDKITPATLTFEMWPDMKDYPSAERFEVPGFTARDGSPACLFSSAQPATVRRHFEWMRDYGIDGVWLQHFLVDLPGGPIAQRYASRTRVLNNVRAAARETGRAWAIAFDVAGMPTDRIFETLIQEWKKLVDEGVTADARYIHEAGLPVVLIWGFYYRNPHNAMTAPLANQLLDFFKAPGPYHAFVAGGGDWNWRLNSNLDWQAFLRRFDAYSPWNVGNFTRDSQRVSHASTRCWAEDKRECEKNRVLWLPVIYPGFSWDNLKKLAPGSSSIPRRGGKFLWEQLRALADLGADSVCVAMFDEVDEGTAILKISNTPPTQGRFVTCDGLPTDWYLRLIGEGTRLLRCKLPVPEDIPIRP